MRQRWGDQKAPVRYITGDWDVTFVPRFKLPSHGVLTGSRDLDATGQHTRSNFANRAPGVLAAIGATADRRGIETRPIEQWYAT
jgi:hypothetical protein